MIIVIIVVIIIVVILMIMIIIGSISELGRRQHAMQAGGQQS